MNLEMVARSEGRPVPTGVLARMAATGIYLLRGIPRALRHAVNGGACRRQPVLLVEAYPERVERARADVAVHDAKGRQ